MSKQKLVFNAKFTLQDMIVLQTAAECLKAQFAKDKDARKSPSYRELIRATRRGRNVIKTTKAIQP